MRNPTELMKSILTNETAQKIIDYVSPIYGNSYVGLWIFQSIGVVLSDVCTIADQLRYETNACTSDLLLDYWERQYGIQKDSSLTKEQRRERIIKKKQNHGPGNRVRLESAVSDALGGAKVDITENTDRNTFRVNIHDVVPSYKPGVSVIERRKPAHLIYRVRACAVTDVNINIGVAVSNSEQYEIKFVDDFANTNIVVATAVTHQERFEIRVFNDFANTSVMVAAAVTHSEQYILEV